MITQKDTIGHHDSLVSRYWLIYITKKNYNFYIDHSDLFLIFGGTSFRGTVAEPRVVFHGPNGENAFLFPPLKNRSFVWVPFVLFDSQQKKRKGGR